MPRPAIAYTDGACINQGFRNAQAGYGVFWGDNHQNNRSGAVDGQQDSNHAELHAARQAIRTAVRQGFDKIIIRSDSHFVRDSIEDSENFQSSPLENRPLIQSIDAMKDNIDVVVEHVQGHSGQYGNEQAHKLARAGAKM